MSREGATSYLIDELTGIGSLELGRYSQVEVSGTVTETVHKKNDLQ